MCFPTSGGFGEGVEQWHFGALRIAGGTGSMKYGKMKYGQNVQMCFDGLSAPAAELPFRGKLPCDSSAAC